MLAIAEEPQMHGSICLAESVLGTYPAEAAGSGAPLRVYGPAATDAGDLRGTADDTVLFTGPRREHFQMRKGEDAPTSDPLPTCSEGSWGVTLDTSRVPDSRFGIASREFLNTQPSSERIRVEPGRQYKIRFHLSSTRPSSTNAVIVMRAHAADKAWTQHFSVLGAWTQTGPATGGNNAIAQQALPGLGCRNPKQLRAGEPGGWYTLLMTSPLSRDIRPEFSPDIPIEFRMPSLCREPGPGVPLFSHRNLGIGLDLEDTRSLSPNAKLEEGNVTLDRIEVYSAPLVID